ncbi:pyridoxal phosphate-dependent aminotransferase, partial [Candidatus Hodarchaeum mangrovi]
ISEFYKEIFKLNYSADQIIVALGSKSLIFHSIAAIDGALLLPTPSWVSYQHQAYLVNKKIIYMQTSPDNSYLLTPEQLLSTLDRYFKDKNQQKVLLLNYPSNPTGQSYSRSQLENLVPILRKNNIIVISDEIYSLITYNNHKHHSLAQFYPEGTIVSGGFSKDRSLGGYRLGILLLPKYQNDLKRAILSIVSEIWSSAASPIQYAAIDAYNTDSVMIDYIKTCTEIHQLMTGYCYKRFSKAGIHCLRPKGGFYLFPDWNNFTEELSTLDITTGRKLGKFLLKKYDIATLPGSEFGMPRRHLSLRVSPVDYNGELVLKEFQKKPIKTDGESEDFLIRNAPNIKMACDRLEQFTLTL